MLAPSAMAGTAADAGMLGAMLASTATAMGSVFWEACVEKEEHCSDCLMGAVVLEARAEKQAW